MLRFDRSWYPLLLSLLVLGSAGCFRHGRDWGETSDAGEDPVPEHPAGVAMVRGTVTRTVDLAPDSDGRGTIVIGALSRCDLSSELVGSVVLPDVDLSEPDARVPFTLDKLPREQLSLVAFFDDNGDADPNQPRPGPGDLVYGSVAGDGVLDCVPVDLRHGSKPGVEIPLAIRVPSAMPVN